MDLQTIKLRSCEQNVHNSLILLNRESASMQATSANTRMIQD